MKGNKPVVTKPVKQSKPVEFPFSVVLHYIPEHGMSIIPIGVNVPHEVMIQMLEMARVEVIKAQLSEMKPTSGASGS